MSKLICLVLLSLASTQAWASKPEPHAQTGDQTTFKKCPGVVAWMRQQKAMHKGEIAIKTITLPHVRDKLIRMAKTDQAERQAWISDKTKNASNKKMAHDDSARTKYLRSLMQKHGVLTTHMVGHDGVFAAWLIAQHSTNLNFQKHYLKALERKDTGLPKSKIALMTDRVLINQGKSQLYGTQFTMKHNRIKLDPVRDRAGLAARRASMGLMPLSAYLCMSEITYGIKR
jgi:hypothetical protein